MKTTQIDSKSNVDTAGYVSTYRFSDGPKPPKSVNAPWSTSLGDVDGVWIWAADRNPVFVAYTPWGFTVTARAQTDPMDPVDVVTRSFGLFEWYSLAQHVAEMLMHYWRIPPGPEPRFYIRSWAEKRCRIAILTRLQTRWRQHVERVDPQMRDVQRSVFAATMQHARITEMPALYERPYIAKDIINYRAAAAAALHIRHLSEIRAVRIAKRSKAAVALKRMAYKMGLWCHVNLGTDCENDEAQIRIDLEALENWPALFSPTGQPYRSLNRTLMNLPGNIPPGLLLNLAKVTLERPIFERRELLLLLIAVDLQSRRHPVPVPFRDLRIFMFSKVPQIKRAVQLIARSTGNALSSNRTRDLMFLARYLADYPEVHRGNLVGLTKKAVKWHRDIYDRDLNEKLDALGRSAKTSLPPIPLPDLPGVRFLDNVEAVAEEGVKMRHCAISYTDDAVNGFAYLFHVEHDGELATVEVGHDGKVRQAQGPRNRRNRAADWGKRVLARWARDFPDEPTSA